MQMQIRVAEMISIVNIRTCATTFWNSCSCPMRGQRHGLVFCRNLEVYLDACSLDKSFAHKNRNQINIEQSIYCSLSAGNRQVVSLDLIWIDRHLVSGIYLLRVNIVFLGHCRICPLRGTIAVGFARARIGTATAAGNFSHGMGTRHLFACRTFRLFVFS